jgi:hypothetical protein
MGTKFASVQATRTRPRRLATAFAASAEGMCPLAVMAANLGETPLERAGLETSVLVAR